VVIDFGDEMKNLDRVN